MSEKRRDNRNRILREGEYQRKDGRYRFRYIDEDEYNYALIGSSSDKYLWILSRAPILPEEIKKKLLDVATRRGYDVKKLIWVEQREKCIQLAFGQE